MNTAVIIDVITAAVLLAFLIAGANRGLLRSVAGLVILVVALVGASFAAAALTPCAASAVQPVIQRRVEARMDKALSGQADSSAAVSVEPVTPPAAGGSGAVSGDTPDTVEQLLGLLKLDSDPAASVVDGARERLRDTGVSVMTAVAESMAETVLHALIFALSFALLMVLAHLAFRALDLVAKLPGLHFANRLGGAAIGLLEGVLAVFLAVWLLRRFGVAFDTGTVESTVLLSFFTTHTPLDMLSFL